MLVYKKQDRWLKCTNRPSWKMERLCVFDLDLTLSVKELSYFLACSSALIDYGFGGKERVGSLQSFFQTLTDEKVAIAVVSFNSKDVVEKALRSTKLLKFIAKNNQGRPLIFGYEIYDDYAAAAKSDVIKNIILPAVGIERTNFVCFLDDLADNCSDVRESLEGAKVIHIKSNGLNAEHMKEVLRWCATISG